MELSKNRIRLLFYICTMTIVIVLIVLLNFMFIDAFRTQANDQIDQLEVSLVDMKKSYVKDIVDVTIQNIEIERAWIYNKEEENVNNMAAHMKTILETEASISEIIDHINEEHVINSYHELLLYDLSKASIEYSYNSMQNHNTEITKEELLAYFDTYRNKAYIENNLYLIVIAVDDDYYDNYIKEVMKDRIRKARFVDKGYIWINQIIDYNGGDEYAIRLVHPNLPDTEGTYLSTNTEDDHGSKPYQKELDGINQDGELFNDYYFKKLDNNIIAHKLSYAKLYKPYDWVIATGVYLDDVDLLLANEAQELIKIQNDVVKKSILLSFVAVFFSGVVIIIFERLILNLISKFQHTVNQKNVEIQMDKEEIEKLAYLDPLTGLLNRRSMLLKLEEAMSEAKRYKQSFSVAIVDIDNFKNINDTYGHIAGDSVLKNLSLLLKDQVRINDSVSRWGGEEFLIILGHSDASTSLSKFDQIRSVVEQKDFEFEGTKIKFTLSIGIATYHESILLYNELIKVADENLYKAKTTGKNRVIC